MILNLEHSFVHPDGNLLTSQAIFAEESLIVEVRIAEFVELTGTIVWRTTRVRGSLQARSVLAFAVAVIILGVVVLSPTRFDAPSGSPIKCMHWRMNGRPSCTEPRTKFLHNFARVPLD